MGVFVNLKNYNQDQSQRGRSSLTVLSWWLIQLTLFRWSPRPMFFFRVLLLRLYGAKIGRNVKIRSSATFTYPWKVTIGDYSWIGDNAEFYSLDSIEVGTNSVISQGTYLCTGSHDMDDPSFRLITKPIRIGDGVWVAAQSFIMPGITIGDHAVVAARSLVTKDIDQGDVVAGHPAGFVKKRGNEWITR